MIQSLATHFEFDIDEPFEALEEDIQDIIRVILSFALSEIDFNIAEALCEKFIKSKEDKDPKMLAITCVGHIARVYRRSVNSNILDEIYKIYRDPAHKYWSTADDALDELKFFLKIRKPKVSKLLIGNGE